MFAENTHGSSSASLSIDKKSEKTFDMTKDGSLAVYARCTKPTKNTLYLTNESQMDIQAISNLNAVASGVAIQSNVVSGVEMTGTLTNINIANVQSGL